MTKSVNRPVNFHTFAVRLTVFNRISHSYGKAQNPHDKFIAWAKFFLNTR